MAPAGGARRTGTTERWPRAAGRRSDSPGSGGSLAVPAAFPRRGNGVPEPLTAVRGPRCGRVGGSGSIGLGGSVPGDAEAPPERHRLALRKTQAHAGKTQARPKTQAPAAKDTGFRRIGGLPTCARRTLVSRPIGARDAVVRASMRVQGRVHLPEPRPAPFPGAPPRRTRRKSHNYNQIKELEHKNTGYRPKDTG